MISHRFVVQSPLQVLMAAEARRTFTGDETHELVVLLPGELAAVEQVRRTVDATQWNNVRTSPPRSRLPLRQAAFVKRIASQPVEHLYIGDAERPLMRHLANSHAGIPTVFDDGLGVERLCRRRRTQAPSTERDPSGRLLRLRTEEVPQLHFFTMFDLDIAERDSSSRNDLASLEQRASTVPVEPARHLLLGGCFVELGVMTEPEYTRMVRRVIAASTGTVEYLPHRREPEDKVKRIIGPTTAVRSELTGPVEATILDEDEAPGHITTFFSTAAYTLWRMFGDRIDFTTFDLHGSGADPSWMVENDMTPFLAAQSSGVLTAQALPDSPSVPLDVNPTR